MSVLVGGMMTKQKCIRLLKICFPTCLMALVGLLVGCHAPVKPYANIQVYDDIKWGILPQIDRAYCKHLGYVRTNTKHKDDFELTLRCSLREVP